MDLFFFVLPRQRENHSSIYTCFLFPELRFCADKNLRVFIHRQSLSSIIGSIFRVKHISPQSFKNAKGTYEQSYFKYNHISNTYSLQKKPSLDFRNSHINSLIMLIRVSQKKKRISNLWIKKTYIQRKNMPQFFHFSKFIKVSFSGH